MAKPRAAATAMPTRRPGWRRPAARRGRHRGRRAGSAPRDGPGSGVRTATSTRSHTGARCAGATRRSLSRGRRRSARRGSRRRPGRQGRDGRRRIARSSSGPACQACVSHDSSPFAAMSWPRSWDLAARTRLLTVPWGRPSSRAASLVVSPSMTVAWTTVRSSGERPRRAARRRRTRRRRAAGPRRCAPPARRLDDLAPTALAAAGAQPGDQAPDGDPPQPAADIAFAPVLRRGPPRGDERVLERRRPPGRDRRCGAAGAAAARPRAGRTAPAAPPRRPPRPAGAGPRRRRRISSRLHCRERGAEGLARQGRLFDGPSGPALTSIAVRTPTRRTGQSLFLTSVA